MRTQFLRPTIWLFLGVMSWISARSLSAAQVGVISTFETESAEGWGGGDPGVSVSGGPAGDGDAFLTTFGAGTNLATRISDPQWVGDFQAAGITSLEADLMNFTTSADSVAMRLVLFGPTNVGNRWVSQTSVTLPADGQWQHVAFPINADSLVRVAGAGSFESLMQNVVRVMLRHDPGTPSSGGTHVTAKIGIDNVTLLGPPANASDFNGDGIVDIADLNLLLATVDAGTNELQFDRTGDQLVNVDDVVFFVTAPTERNTYIGDANLNGQFDTEDLVVLFQAGQYEDAAEQNSTWETGDWDGDRDFNTGDLLLAFQQGGFEAGPRAAIAAVQVPEPTTATLCIVGVLSWIACRRRVTPSRVVTRPVTQGMTI